jgi:hypothetical protein
MSFMCLNYPLTFYLLGNYVNWVIYLFFYFSGVYVQDPRTGQTLGTGRRVGRLFELSSLHLSIPGVSAAAAASSSTSLALWHLLLSHASVSRVQVLVSKGLLGLVSKESFDCISCQLRK